ncbi:MAG: energy transducer TonB [Acidobacteriota bacterium]
MKTLRFAVAAIALTIAAGSAQQAPPSPVKVAAGVTKGLLVRQVRPNYPQAAKDARVQGVVVLSVLIGPSGLVESLTGVSGPDLLQQAAVDAVSQWAYRPYLLNGEPVSVRTDVEINFALQ